MPAAVQVRMYLIGIVEFFNSPTSTESSLCRVLLDNREVGAGDSHGLPSQWSVYSQDSEKTYNVHFVTEALT